MPIFEFVCDKCGHEFEELVMGDGRCNCPACGSSDTHKLMSACARRKKEGGMGEAGYSMPSGGGCAGCSGGNCASCGH